jgi:sigma-B regulation protein RsbU (phosphoserine phosphatase)
VTTDSKILINLESLLALGAKLSETIDEKSILNITLLSLMGKLKLFRGIVFVPDDTYEFFIPIIIKGKTDIQQIRAFPIKEICKISDITDNHELFESGFEICIPIIYRDYFFAVICLSGKLDNSDMSEEEFYYASLVSNIAANAMNNTRNINLLLREKNTVESKNQLLTTLFEVSRDFNVFLSEEKIIKTLELNLLGQLMITNFAVIFNDVDNRNYAEEAQENQAGFNQNINLKILKNTFKENLPIDLLPDLFHCNETCFTNELVIKDELMQWLQRNNVWVVSPMLMKSEIKGFLLIGKSRVGRQFSQENLLFIKVIGNTTVLAIENLKMIQKEVERQKLENELAIALEIQNRLLPKKNPEIIGFDIYGTTKPSKFVGGDYFDFIKLPNGNLLVAIADVSGKGMPAALLMANFQAGLRALAAMDIPLSELVTRLNVLIYNNTTADRFITFFAGELDSDSREFKYINAGHNPPILMQADGKLELLTSGGIILGVIENTVHYKQGKIKLGHNDIILLYTDGVTESIDKNHCEYGEKRLLQTINKEKYLSSKQIIESIMLDVNQHAQAQPQYDDITLIAIKSV